MISQYAWEKIHTLFSDMAHLFLVDENKTIFYLSKYPKPLNQPQTAVSDRIQTHRLHRSLSHQLDLKQEADHYIWSHTCGENLRPLSHFSLVSKAADKIKEPKLYQNPLFAA